MYVMFTHLYQSTPAALTSTQPSVSFRMVFIVTTQSTESLRSTYCLLSNQVIFVSFDYGRSYVRASFFLFLWRKGVDT